jgi:thiol-disulfide isomerase/thioredoxin
VSKQLAPPWKTTLWLNTPEALSLEGLRGRVVLVHAFQMLCPGCVSRGLPQAQRVAEAFRGAPLSVIGLHTVFEHHDAMREASLRAFVHEYRIRFPVGIDAPGEGGETIPQTMRAYGLQGTPTTLLIDGEGYLREHTFGVHDDLLLGASIQRLLHELGDGKAEGGEAAETSPGTCSDESCSP